MFDQQFALRRKGMMGLRWLDVAMRTLHLVGVCGVGGGILLAVPHEHWMFYLQLTLVSGLALLLLEIAKNKFLLIELRGVAIALKLVLLGAMYLFPEQGSVLLVAIVVISGIGSHAPKKFRHLRICATYRAKQGTSQ